MALYEALVPTDGYIEMYVEMLEAAFVTTQSEVL